jgi:hypothetical protein
MFCTGIGNSPSTITSPNGRPYKIPAGTPASLPSFGATYFGMLPAPLRPLFFPNIFFGIMALALLLQFDRLLPGPPALPCGG